MKLIKTPWLLKKMYSNYVWNIKTSSEEKVLYLTFDDGPTSEVTERVLDILQQHNAKATFFCIGKNIEAHPEIFKRILSEGHIVGNHTHNHVHGWKNSTQDYIKNTLIAEQVMSTECKVESSEFRIRSENKSEVTNHKAQNKNKNVTLSAVEESHSELITLNSKLFRPPYGKIKRNQAKKLQELGYKIIMWDILSYDWDKKTTKEQTLKNIINNATSGSIIVFHDSLKASNNMLYTLPKVLKHFKNENYKFKKLEL